MSWVTVGVAAAGMLAGKAKNDRAQEIESADRKLAAETQRYSPWTGMSANKIQRAGSQFGDMFAGGTQGAMLGQSLSNGMAGMGGVETPASAGGGGMSLQEAGQTMSPYEKAMMNQKKTFVG